MCSAWNYWSWTHSTHLEWILFYQITFLNWINSEFLMIPASPLITAPEFRCYCHQKLQKLNRFSFFPVERKHYHQMSCLEFRSIILYKAVLHLLQICDHFMIKTKHTLWKFLGKEQRGKAYTFHFIQTPHRLIKQKQIFMHFYLRTCWKNTLLLMMRNSRTRKEIRLFNRSSFFIIFQGVSEGRMGSIKNWRLFSRLWFHMLYHY